MSGLYQRALEIYRQTVGLRLVPKDEAAPSIEEVSPAEREKILHQIDEVVARNRVVLAPESFRISPRRSGIGLPLWINAVVVAVLLAAMVVSSRLLNRQEQVLAAGGGAILSAESKLIETLRQESQRELAQKDRAILEAQARLAEVSRERERLRSETAEAIRRREGELAGELTQALEAERARLQAQGLSTSTVDQRLASFEADRRSELDRQAEAFRRQVEEQAALREQEIAQLSGQYEQSLRQAQEQRARLETDMQARQAELQQQVRQQSEQTQSAERERAATAAELARLQEAQARQNLVLDQLLTMYDTVNRQISAGQDAQALQSLGALRAYFDQEPARSLPGIQRRRPVEMFLIGSLEELIQARQSRQEQQKAATLVEAGSRLDALRQGMQRAEERFQAGDYGAARQLYQAALAEVPEALRGQERLARLEELERERTRRGALELAAQGAASYQAGQWQATLDRYRQALVELLGDQALAGRLVEQVGRASRELELAALPAAAAPGQPEVTPAQLAELQAQQAAAVEQIRTLQAENARLSSTLSSREQQALQARQEQLAAGQVSSAYQGVNRSLQAGRYAEAQGELAELRASLDREPARSLPGMQARRPVELFLISSLEELIAAKTRQGETAEAGAARQAGQVSAALREAQVSYAHGQYQSSLDQYRQALELLLADAAAARRVVDQVAEAGYQLKAAPLVAQAQQARGVASQLQAENDQLQVEVERAQAQTAEREVLRSRLAGLKAQYAHERSSSSRASLNTPETLATLLQAKLLTLQILASEPVASSYPQLYDQLQEYLDSFASQQLLDGRYSALQDALSVLDNALGTERTPGARLSELWRRYVYTDRDDLLADLFERLETLLR
jgi:hypothetical protein